MKTGLITGSRKGIGRAAAEHYLGQGFRVVGCSRGPSNLMDENYEHVELDVGDESAVVRVVRRVARDYGGIDVLINNAGIASMNSIALTPGKTADSILRTNVLGTFHCLREVAKVMARARKGRIVNISSIAVPLALEGEAIYAASKASIESITRVAARELGALGITVNAVGPAPVKTHLLRGVPEKALARLLDRQSIHRFAEYGDILNVMDFFIAENSDFVTGQVIYLGGV